MPVTNYESYARHLCTANYIEAVDIAGGGGRWYGSAGRSQTPGYGRYLRDPFAELRGARRRVTVVVDQHHDVQEWIEERQQRFITVADEIWKKPQVALEETEACELQIDELEREGFKITLNVGDLPTAFVAEWGSGRPIIGFLGEYDALPGLSQK